MATTNNETEIIEPKHRFIITQLKPKKKSMLKYRIKDCKSMTNFIFTYNAKRGSWLCSYEHEPHDSWGFDPSKERVNDINYITDMVQAAIIHSWGLLPYKLVEDNFHKELGDMIKLGDTFYTSPSNSRYVALSKLGYSIEHQTHNVEFIYSPWSYSFDRYSWTRNCSSCKKRRAIVNNSDKLCTKCGKEKPSICSYCEEGLCSNCDNYGIKPPSDKWKKKFDAGMEEQRKIGKRHNKFFKQNFKAGDRIIVIDHTRDTHLNEYTIKEIKDTDAWPRITVVEDESLFIPYNEIAKIEPPYNA